MLLPDRESNPGLPRDRRRSSPLDYRGLCLSAANIYGTTDQEAICFCIIGYSKKETNPSSRIWTSDLWISDANNYSPPLYQLSYRRCPPICCCSSQVVMFVVEHHKVIFCLSTTTCCCCPHVLMLPVVLLKIRVSLLSNYLLLLFPLGLVC